MEDIMTEKDKKLRFEPTQVAVKFEPGVEDSQDGTILSITESLSLILNKIDRLEKALV